MTTLKIDSHTAARLIAQVLRDDLKVPPGKANEIALAICSRICSSTPDPLRSGFGAGWRAIGRHPPRDEVVDMVTKLRENLPQADGDLLDDVWQLFYEYGREVPDAVML